MKAKELRIGNFIYADGLHGGVIKTVEGIDVKGTLREENRVILFKDHPVGEFIQHCKGIPLTEEWLLKFGFKKVLDEYKNELWEYQYDNGSQIRLWNYNNEGYFFELHDSHPAIKYIHSLQNFIFALTGKELELKKEETTETK